MSIPRQVAKTFIVGRIVFALCTLFPGLRVIWTAHRTRTATNTFQKLQALAQRKGAAKYIKSIRVANGEQQIEFVNGSIILFGAREQGFGRGFDEVDIEVFDEAQILTERALEDMIAAMNQARHVHGALAFFMGTPPRPIDPGEAFSEMRRGLLDGENPDGLYIETSADPSIGRKGGPSLDDHDQWRIANPSFPTRTPLASMKRLRKLLPSDDAWRREAMGVWDARGQLEPPVIDPDTWAALKIPVVDVPAPKVGEKVGYGIKFSPDGARMALAVALELNDGRTFVEVLDSGSTSVGLSGLTSWVSERWRNADGTALDGKGSAGALVERLLEAGVRSRHIQRPTWDQIVTANSDFVEAARDGRLAHAGQPGLVASVEGARRENRGAQGGWGFAPNAPGVDVTPTEAVVLAVSALKTKARRKSGRTSSGEVNIA